MKQAVFLDRDGVIVEEQAIHHRYLHHPSQVKLMPYAAQAIRKLNQEGILVLVATNQGRVSLGRITQQELDDIHEEMKTQLKRGFAHIDRIYAATKYDYNRKPNPGMLLQGEIEFGLDLTKCYFVGDQETDMQVAHKVDCVAIAVEAQPHGVHWKTWKHQPDAVAKHLGNAVEIILALMKGKVTV